MLHKIYYYDKLIIYNFMKRGNSMRYEIKGTPFPAVICYLDAGELYNYMPHPSN